MGTMGVQEGIYNIVTKILSAEYDSFSVFSNWMKYSCNDLSL